MHIPDGYLAPAVYLALAVPTVPVWAVATQKVDKVLNSRTVPLLAVFSALSFTVMERAGLTHAIAFDRHFREYGRWALL